MFSITAEMLAFSMNADNILDSMKLAWSVNVPLDHLHSALGKKKKINVKPPLEVFFFYLRAEISIKCLIARRIYY